MKVTLEYDETTGNVTDSTGLIIGTYLDLKPFDATESKSADVAQLMAMGATADDLLKLKAAGVI